MEFPKPDFATTPYGDVDSAALERLRTTFDTSQLLDLVETLDRLLPRVKALQNGIRDDLLRLHRMANTVLNGAALTEHACEEDLWEVAKELVDEFHDLSNAFAESADVLQPLVDLQPSQDE